MTDEEMNQFFHLDPQPMASSQPANVQVTDMSCNATLLGAALEVCPSYSARSRYARVHRFRSRAIYRLSTKRDLQR